MKTVKEFPISEKSAVIAIDSSYTQTCIIKALFHDGALYVQQLVDEKQSLFINEVHEKYNDIFQRENTFILGAECPSNRLYFHREGFYVVSVIRHNDVLKNMFNGNIVVVTENADCDFCKILDDFKKAKDIERFCFVKYQNGGKFLWTLALAFSYFWAFDTHGEMKPKINSHQ